MAKKFKLVYDQKGDLKGSYTGIPSTNDPVLIERAVLDGEKAPAPKPAGEKKITENGKYDVSNFASADVNVEGVQPAGTLNINENGQYDVFNKANVDVNVPQGVFPEGTLEITENGEYDVTEKAGVNVDVKGLVPAGNKEITSTAQTDVTEFATAQVVDANLVAENIKKDITILGILGTLEGGSDGLDELMQEEF